MTQGTCIFWLYKKLFLNVIYQIDTSTLYCD